MTDDYLFRSPPRSSYAAKAFAKVNLHLAVGPARADGFHELVTIFQSLNLADTVRVSLANDQIEQDESSGHGPVRALTVTGQDSNSVPSDATNLAWQAVDAVAAALQAEHAGKLELPPVTVAIEKNIPVAGGMAGGSADAAAALRAANSLFAEQVNIELLDESVLHNIAAQLGSDVPFCLHGYTALGQGRGEKLHAVPTTGTYHWALVANEQGLSTPQVFAEFDQLYQGSPQPDAGDGEKKGKPAVPHDPSLSETTALTAAAQSGDVQQLAGLLRNDLQAAALRLRPDLSRILDAGSHAGALAGIVSGSGPTCAFLCADEQTAHYVAAEVEKKIAGTRGITATSPAGGAELIEC